MAKYEDGFREDLEKACLEGLVSTEHGYRYRPAKGADAVEEILWRVRAQTLEDLARSLPLGNNPTFQILVAKVREIEAENREQATG